MPSDRRTWRKLGEALLNATLMLIALIVLLAVVLVMQVRGLTSDLRADLAGMQDRSVEARSQAEEALAALEAARAERGDALPEAVARARDGLSAALDGWAEQAPEGGGTSLVHRMMMAAVIAAAREAQAAGVAR
jgi:hypothetical protein